MCFRARDERERMSNKSQSQLPKALQRIRLNKHWSQEVLANQLHVNLRTAISWEAGERIPSIGMVFLLWFVSTNGLETSNDLLPLELLVNYLLADLERQVKAHPDEAFLELVARGSEKLLHILQSLAQPEQMPVPLSLLPEPSRKNASPDVEPTGVSGGRSQVDQREAGTTDMEQLFTLLERLRARPDLVPVVNDFLDQVMVG